MSASSSTVSDAHEALLRAHGFTSRCPCPDAAGPYEPCECCGTPVGWHHNGFVEGDLTRGCPTDGAGHCQAWTQHTPSRCRQLAQLSQPRPLCIDGSAYHRRTRARRKRKS